MKLTNKILIYFIALTNICHAQNLVLNPSFEQQDSCPYQINQIHFATHWFQPNTANNSSDYYSGCSSNTPVSVPDNITGFQFARSGISYAGIWFGVGTPICHSEYIEGVLSDTLLAGHKYCVSFYVSRADSVRFVTDGIGLYLSEVAVLSNNPSFYCLPFTPQVANPSGNIITDSITWTLISDTIVANGGEKYFVIGNFNQSAIFVLENNSGFIFSYYYIDDVSITICDSTVEVIENAPLTLSLFPTIADEFINISINNPVEPNAEIRIYSAVGTLLIQKPYNKIINVNGLPSGVYFIRVISGGREAVGRFYKR
jgi:hypothetical protein